MENKKFGKTQFKNPHSFFRFICIGTKVTDSRKSAAPSFSFGQKHRQTEQSLGEGPAKYNVTGLGNKGKDTPPAATLQSRHKEMSRFSTPAPGEYDIQKAVKAINQSTPKYTFGQKLATEKCDTTPGKFEIFFFFFGFDFLMLRIPI